MDAPVPEGVTQLLLEWRNGDESALERLIPLVYRELRKLARRCLRGERPGHTLQTTGLVNEAYLRLVHSSRVEWRDRAHFFAVASQFMPSCPSAGRARPRTARARRVPQPLMRV